MSHLRFCNDFLQTPPIFAYVRFRRDLYTGSLEKKEDIKRLLEIFERRNCPIFTLHTSGHADGDAIQKLIKAVNPKETIFVHGEA